jgi:hypothetical protein
VMMPMGVNLSVGLGDTRERAQASHEAAMRLYDSITRGDKRRATRPARSRNRGR